MAATTAIESRIESGLALVEGDISALPEWASQWEGLDEGTQVSLSLEWTHSMADYLTELDEHYQGGQMTPSQQARYRELLDNLGTALPTIDQLRLYRPPVRQRPN